MIPLSTPNIGPRAKELVQQAMEDGWVSSSGPQVKAFEEAIADYCEVPYAIATNSGTAALHLAMQVNGIGPGDLVIAPNLTFVASLHPAYYLGAEAVLVDVNPFTWQMDPDLVEEFLIQDTEEREGQRYHKASGKRIAAILAVHVLGYACDVLHLEAMADTYGLALIEDAAEAMGARLDGQHLGTFGDAGVLSFNGNKIMTTGGGGALLLRKPADAEYARILSQQAKRHYQEYLHDEIGYNYRMTNLSAAMGLGQLEQMEAFQARKTEVWKHYKEALADVDVKFVSFGENVLPNHWLTTILHPDARMLEEVLAVQEIQTRKLWIPMDRLPHLQDCHYVNRHDHSQVIYDASLSLPCSTHITDAELETVTTAIRKFFGK